MGIFVLAGPQDRFTEEEFQVLKEFVEKGGKLWVMLGEGGEQEFNTNVNFFLEQYGIYINSGELNETNIHMNTLVCLIFYRIFQTPLCAHITTKISTLRSALSAVA